MYVTTLEKTRVKLNFPEPLASTVKGRVYGQKSDDDVDNAVFDAYNLTSDERDYIRSHRKVNRK